MRMGLQCLERGPHIGIEVDRENNLHVWPIGKFDKRCANAAKSLAVALTAMARDQNKLFAWVEERKTLLQVFLGVPQGSVHHVMKRIDDSIARHQDAILGHALVQ